jgi:hypothetical protein
MAYIWAMPKHKSESEWRVIRLRSKGQYLGTVKAVDHDAAVKMALKQFGVDKSEADRLLIRRYRASARAVETNDKKSPGWTVAGARHLGNASPRTEPR